jgi:acetyltransferase
MSETKAMSSRPVPMQNERLNDGVPASPVTPDWWTMRDGTQVAIRPIRPEDEPLMIAFHEGISGRSVYMRYFESLSFKARTKHERLLRICFADSQQETVLVAVHTDPSTQAQRILAVGRLSKLSDGKTAEIAALVSDDSQGRGLGTELLKRLLLAAPSQGVHRINAEMLRDNTLMQSIAKKLGFRLCQLKDPRSVRASLDL